MKHLKTFEGTFFSNLGRKADKAFRSDLNNMVTLTIFKTREVGSKKQEEIMCDLVLDEDKAHEICQVLKDTDYRGMVSSQLPADYTTPGFY